jgi:hypothetical protein
MAPRTSIDHPVTRLGHSFLLVRCRRGERVPVAFALRGLIQPERLDHVRGHFDIVAKLSAQSDSDLDWLNDLPGIEGYVRLETAPL